MTYAGTGGLTFTGLATERDAGIFQGTGALVLSGVADFLAGQYIASGVIVLSGNAPFQVGYVVGSSGGLTLTGVAMVPHCEASGGLVLSGSITSITGYGYSANGHIVLSGLAGVTQSFFPSTSGSLVFSGITSQISTESFQGSGRITLTGTAGVMVSYTPHTAGRLRFAGYATAKKTAVNPPPVPGPLTPAGVVIPSRRMPPPRVYSGTADSHSWFNRQQSGLVPNATASGLKKVSRRDLKPGQDTSGIMVVD
jgi:hypothetical protein